MSTTVEPAQTGSQLLGAVSRKRLVLSAGRSNPALAEEIATELGIPLSRPELRTFGDGEIHCRFDGSVRGADVFVLQSMCAPINDRLIEHLVMIDALKRAAAGRIIAVTLNYPYARQDKKALPGEPISARLIANLYEAAGIDRLLAVDLHSAQIEGFHSAPVDHLSAIPLLSDYVARQVGQAVTVVSPDSGRVRTAEKFGQRLGAPIAFLHKQHDPHRADHVEVLEIVGQVAGRACVLVDDMIVTGGTISSAAALLVRQGASSAWAVATHGVLLNSAIERLEQAPIERVVVTNSVPISDDRRFPALVVLSLGPLIAEAIRAIFSDGSVRSSGDSPDGQD